MDITVCHENHSLSGGLLLKWRMGLHPHLSLTGTPMVMKTMVGVFHSLRLGCGYLQNELLHTFVQTESGWTDVSSMMQLTLISKLFFSESLYRI